jgi:casein kinase 1/casein kinase 1 epsilon
MVMECLGRNLEQIFQNQNYNFSLKTICLLAEQMFSRIEFFHSKNFIHRDIKPENFIMGTLENNKNVYLIDFGLAKRFKNKNGLHIPYRDGKNLTGTLRYASCNNHLGIEQSRRDDIESIGYVLLYFFKKNLPWMNVKGKNEKEKLKKILDIKINSKLSDICQGIPKEIELIIQYSRDLKFDEKPNYDLIQRLIKGIGEKNGFTFDYMFDWICDDEKKKKEKENKEIHGNFKE